MSTTANIADRYARAWTSGDVDTAMNYVADDIVCDAPAGRIEGVAAYRPFTQRFVDALSRATITKLLADDTSAAILYSVDVPWAKDFRCVEYMTIADGKIKHVTTVFDRLPARQAAG